MTERAHTRKQAMAPALSERAQGVLLGAALTAGVGAALLSLRSRKGRPASDAAVRQAIVEALEHAKASRPEVKLPHQHERKMQERMQTNPTEEVCAFACLLDGS